MTYLLQYIDPKHGVTNDYYDTAAEAFAAAASIKGGWTLWSKEDGGTWENITSQSQEVYKW